MSWWSLLYTAVSFRQLSSSWAQQECYDKTAYFFLSDRCSLLLQYVVVDVVQWTVLEMLPQLTSESPIVGLFFFCPQYLLVSNCLLSECVKAYLLVGFYSNIGIWIYSQYPSVFQIYVNEWKGASKTFSPFLLPSPFKTLFPFTLSR